MVHKVLSYTRQVQNTRDTMLLQLIRRSDSRPQENGRAAIGATADDNFLARIERMRFGRGILDDNSSSIQVAGRGTLNQDLVDCAAGEDGDIPALEPIRDEIRTRGAQPLVHCARHMATAMRCVARREHIRHERNSRRDKRRQDKL